MKLTLVAPIALAAAFAVGCSNESADTASETSTPVEEAAPMETSEPAPMPEAEPMATITEFSATLAAPEGVESAGTGVAALTLDPSSKTLTYTITYEGTTGPGIAAHIHGPAEPGANAGVVVPFASAESPITGEATLTDDQIAELEAGKYYVNIHTDANKGGEIRGTILGAH